MEPPTRNRQQRRPDSYLVRKVRANAQVLRARFTLVQLHCVRDTFTLEATVVRRSLMARDLRQDPILGQKLVGMMTSARIPTNFHGAIRRTVPNFDAALVCLVPPVVEDDGSVTAPSTEAHAYTDLDRPRSPPAKSDAVCDDPNPRGHRRRQRDEELSDKEDFVS